MAERLLIGGALAHFINYRIIIDGPLRPEHFDLLAEIVLQQKRWIFEYGPRVKSPDEELPGPEGLGAAT
jgi:hypothetical protein